MLILTFLFSFKAQAYHLRLLINLETKVNLHFLLLIFCYEDQLVLIYDFEFLETAIGSLALVILLYFDAGLSQSFSIQYCYSMPPFLLLIFLSIEHFFKLFFLICRQCPLKTIIEISSVLGLSIISQLALLFVFAILIMPLVFSSSQFGIIKVFC